MIAAAVPRSVRIGGVGRNALLAALEASGVAINDAGRELFAQPGFTTLPAAVEVGTVELSVAALGHPDGATFRRIVDAASRRGLAVCPLEVGPHLRLQWPDQPEGAIGQPATPGRAPPGSVTVASAPPADDDAVPKGFYLRRIEGTLWLRGYRSHAAHLWAARDRFVFRVAAGDPP